MYHFFGNEHLELKLNNASLPNIKNIRDLYDAFSICWSIDTCAPRLRHKWNKNNITVGQCSITSFIVQDLFGGEVYGVLLEDGNYHCFNVINNVKFDLTSEQFDKPLEYENVYKQSRDEHFQKEEKYQRYLLLKKRLLGNK